MRHPALLLLFLCFAAGAAERATMSGPDVQKRLDYIAKIQRFQGMFDSVIGFCDDHVPPYLLERIHSSWLRKNQPYLDFRDSELSRLLEQAEVDGAADEDISRMRSWIEEQYESRLHHDRLYRDIVDEADLLIPCSRRLGEMLSSSMTLDTLSPESIEYYEFMKDVP